MLHYVLQEEEEGHCVSLNKINPSNLSRNKSLYVIST